MIIKPDFTERYDPRTARQFAQRSNKIRRGFADGIGMDANRGVDIGKTMRQFDGATAPLDRRPDGNDAFDARIGRSCPDLGKIRFKVAKIEVRVGVNKHDGYLAACACW